MSSLTLATFFFLRHLPDASGRGIGKPLRTTNRSRLVFRYTSNILRPPSRLSEYRGEQKWQQLRPATMDRQAATDLGSMTRRAQRRRPSAQRAGRPDKAVGVTAQMPSISGLAADSKCLACAHKQLRQFAWYKTI